MKIRSSIFKIGRILIKSKVVLLFAMMVPITLGMLYIYDTWQDSINETTELAINIGETAEAGYQKSMISSLISGPIDVKDKDYIQIKASLAKLVEIHNGIQFSYIYAQKDGKIYLIADSESSDSEDYSPPWQEYTEATQVDFQPFKDGRTTLTDPITDRWGTWVSVLVPMKDIETGKIIAVFGLDYPAESWGNYARRDTARAVIIVLCILLIIISFYWIIVRNMSLKEEKDKLFIVSEKLKENEEIFRTVFEQSPIGISIATDYKNISEVNCAFSKITGRSKQELSTINWNEVTHPEEQKAYLNYFDKFKSGEINDYTMIKRYIRPDGTDVWVNLIVVPLKFNNKLQQSHLHLIEDITERIHSEQDLRESERSKAVLLSNLPGMAYRCKYDPDWTMQFVSEGCFDITGYEPESLINNKDISFNALISLEYQNILWDKWIEVLSTKTKLKEEYKIITATGEVKWVFEQGQGIYTEDGEIEALEGLIIDITEQKLKEKEIEYLSYHDYLTGHYNRRFFEEEKKKFDTQNYLPLSVIVGDINGLKLINDALGHAEGDKLITKTAEILQSSCRTKDVLARTGGDEFCILLPTTDSKSVSDVVESINHTCREYMNNKLNESYINISLGFATKNSFDEDIDLIIKIAEDNMYKQKLLVQSSSRSTIISSIKATMFERSQETEEHAERLALLSNKVGISLNLSQTELNDLELLSTLHDVGKVGIDDRILNKPGKLSDEEWIEMKKHPEIGYRIAMATAELRPIAEYILAHHERWDGKGYPRGLKGEEILLLARIISVVDAYDAMTQDRVYRKAMSISEAIDELKNYSGTQFDPMIVDIFLKMLSEDLL